MIIFSRTATIRFTANLSIQIHDAENGYVNVCLKFYMNVFVDRPTCI